MNVLGIIAEYNPFHNGHRYLIEAARQKHPGAAVVCVMSGHFLQRGEPALVNKWARAEMAVHGGADVVIELPVSFSVRSAYYFARGALGLLAQTGVVTHLLFGSESGCLQELQAIAEFLSCEPRDYRDQLKLFLGQGYSYPVARSMALQGYLGNSDRGLQHLLGQPNNILALEYLRVIKEMQLKIEPITIPRLGGFHDEELHGFASATAIRLALSNRSNRLDLHPVMPAPSRTILEREIIRGAAPVFDTDLEALIFYRLRTMSHRELAEVYEVNEGLEYRIKDAAIRSTSLPELRQAIKSKRYSMTRINRTLIYALLDITRKKIEQFDERGALYYHILAFSERGQSILQKLRDYSSLPVLSRGHMVKKAASGKFGTAVKEMISLDIIATDLFSLLLPHPDLRRGGQDFITSPYRLATDSSPSSE